MVGINPVTTTYNPALLQQQQQAMALGQQPMVAQPATAGMNDLQQALAGANALGIEGTTQVLPQILAMSQQTDQLKEAARVSKQQQEQILALQAQLDANALKGQQQGVQTQALQQLQTTIPAIPQIQQPTIATNSLESQKSAAITSGNLGELANVMTSEVTSNAPNVQKAMDDALQVQTYRNALMAQGIPKDQATALANQKFQADNAVATGQAVIAQQPIMLQQPLQPVVQAPVATQPIQQLTLEPPAVTDTIATSPAATPTVPIQEEMVNIAGVGLVSKATLIAVLQNTSPEAQEQAQQQAQQQPPASTATATPRAVLPADYTLQQALPQTTLIPEQALTGLPPVASPLAFASVNSYGNSGITAEKYQQLLAYMNQQQQLSITPTTTSSESVTVTSHEEDNFSQAKIEAEKLGFDTTNMPNSYAERRAQQQKRHKRVMAQMLKRPKLYVPKPDDSKYAAYGGGDSEASA